MINLFIDTSSSRIVVALTKNSQLINIINEVNGHDLSSRALPLIDKLLKMSNTEPSAIDRIYVVNGPGSFTGIRIGVTIAKMMAWTLNKEIVTISELELLATTDFDTDYIIPWIDARRKAVFAGVYDKNGNVVEDKYIKIQDLQNNTTDPSKRNGENYQKELENLLQERDKLNELKEEFFKNKS